ASLAVGRRRGQGVGGFALELAPDRNHLKVVPYAIGEGSHLVARGVAGILSLHELALSSSDPDTVARGTRHRRPGESNCMAGRSGNKELRSRGRDAGYRRRRCRDDGHTGGERIDGQIVIAAYVPAIGDTCKAGRVP